MYIEESDRRIVCTYLTVLQSLLYKDNLFLKRLLYIKLHMIGEQSFGHFKNYFALRCTVVDFY